MSKLVEGKVNIVTLINDLNDLLSSYSSKINIATAVDNNKIKVLAFLDTPEGSVDLNPFDKDNVVLGSATLTDVRMCYQKKVDKEEVETLKCQLAALSREDKSKYLALQLQDENEKNMQAKIKKLKAERDEYRKLAEKSGLLSKQEDVTPVSVACEAT